MLKERFSDITITDLPPLRVACFRAISRTPEDDALRVLSVSYTHLGRRPASCCRWPITAGRR